MATVSEPGLYVSCQPAPQSWGPQPPNLIIVGPQPLILSCGDISPSPLILTVVETPVHTVFLCGNSSPLPSLLGTFWRLGGDGLRPEPPGCHVGGSLVALSSQAVYSWPPEGQMGSRVGFQPGLWPPGSAVCSFRRCVWCDSACVLSSRLAGLTSPLASGLWVPPLPWGCSQWSVVS